MAKTESNLLKLSGFEEFVQSAVWQSLKKRIAQLHADLNPTPVPAPNISAHTLNEIILNNLNAIIKGVKPNEGNPGKIALLNFLVSYYELLSL